MLRYISRKKGKEIKLECSSGKSYKNSSTRCEKIVKNLSINNKMFPELKVSCND